MDTGPDEVNQRCWSCPRPSKGDDALRLPEQQTPEFNSNSMGENVMKTLQLFTLFATLGITTAQAQEAKYYIDWDDAAKKCVIQNKPPVNQIAGGAVIIVASSLILIWMVSMSLP